MPANIRPHSTEEDDGILKDGERIGFELMFRDGAPRGTPVFLTDQRVEDQVAAEVSYMYGQHVAKFAFMGDRAPKFDRALAEVKARANLAEPAGKAVVAHIVANRHNLSDRTAVNGDQSAQSGRPAAVADNAAAVAAIRAARYGN